MNKQQRKQGLELGSYLSHAIWSWDQVIWPGEVPASGLRKERAVEEIGHRTKWAEAKNMLDESYKQQLNDPYSK